MGPGQFSVGPACRQPHITAGKNFLAKDLFDPSPVFFGIPPRTLGVTLRHAHQLGHRLGIARDKNLVLDLQRGLRLRPALPQVADSDRLHGYRVTCFTYGTQSRLGKLAESDTAFVCNEVWAGLDT